MTLRHAVAIPLLALLAGCSERVIASAGDVLVVVEDIEAASPNTTATAHYVLSKPLPLSDEPGAPLVSRMRYELEVDCSRNAMGHRLQETTLTDGQVVSNHPASVLLEEPKPGTTGASVVSSICDPEIRKANTVSRSLKSIERGYRERSAG